MKFEVYGPFEITRTSKGLVSSDAASKREFWEWVDGVVPSLPDACGCYVFAIQVSRGILPWYVGKAEKQPFAKECLSTHKVNHYNNAIVGRKGRPTLYLLPQVTKNGKYRKVSKSKKLAISELETMLMGMAISRNPGMLNIKGTRMMRELTVEGFLNSKKSAGGKASSELRNILGG